MAETGHCEHGEFNLMGGCYLCIEERRAWEAGQSTGNAPPSLGSTTALPVAEVAIPIEMLTALVKIKPEADSQVMAFYNEALRAKHYSEARIIVTVDDLKPATDDLSLIANLKKVMEEKRKEYVKPLQDHVKAINDAFKTLMEPIETADQITRAKILAFQLKQKLIREEQEEINRLRIEATQRDAKLHDGEISELTQLVEVIPPIPTTIRTDMGSTSTFKVRRYRVVNFAELPDQYKIENSALLNKVVKAGIPSIPGVEIYTENSLRVKAN